MCLLRNRKISPGLSLRVLATPMPTGAVTIARSHLQRHRIQQLRDKAAKRAGVTLEDHLKTMQLLRDRASRKTQYSAAVRAEECRAKASGLYVDIHRHEGPDGGPIQSIVTFAADDKLLAAIKLLLKEL